MRTSDDLPGGIALGITIWNGLFIAAGYFAKLAAPGMSASTLAIKMLVLLIATEALFALIWRVAARYRWRAAPRGSRS